jgi:hypothetical protein
MPEARLARNLDQALRRMSWRVEDGRFALVAFSEEPTRADWSALRAPSQMIREVEETTLLLHEEELAGVLGRHPGARVELDLVWIRFDAPMGWEVVGFLALVTGELARAGVPLGAICAHARDHLFLSANQLETAR